MRELIVIPPIRTAFESVPIRETELPQSECAILGTPRRGRHPELQNHSIRMRRKPVNRRLSTAACAPCPAAHGGLPSSALTWSSRRPSREGLLLQGGLRLGAVDQHEVAAKVAGPAGRLPLVRRDRHAQAGAGQDERAVGIELELLQSAFVAYPQV